ncbi:probable rRNA-processing protein EBP2 homolog [Thrips palmi]|uniref:Probable rRNA-processing protein EBP2 homolog n=1 Tax=Thrips palmi TaxID=161013 RepID=A0A6P8ZMV0_THRPL|nr:probable rRNA-processing protein EBP2 homolog [Thrips palmi]
MSDSSDYEDHESGDSDAELQAAFASGLLKPGLNIPVEPKKVFTNNVAGLNLKHKEIQQSLKWIERLDLTTGLAPIAPEMAVYIAEKEEEAGNPIKKVKKSLDPTVDDFKREMNFHRQAQAAVLEGIPRLHSLGVKTKRPDDYFAQMAKSDEHMQKVRDSLLKKKAGLEVSEKVRKIRENRKMMKTLQAQAVIQRQKDKRDLMEEVKKYRKGARKDLDFLEPGGDKKKQGQQGHKKKLQNKPADRKRQKKDEKYGLGGKKGGLKRNTKESSADVSSYRPPPRNKKAGGKNAKGQKRPGKSRRHQNGRPKRR